MNYYGPKYHLPEAYSDNASFLYWMPQDYDRFDVLLLVTDDKQEMEHRFIKEFKVAQLVDSIVNPYARRDGTASIILLKGPSDAFRKGFRGENRQRQTKDHRAGGGRFFT